MIELLDGDGERRPVRVAAALDPRDVEGLADVVDLLPLGPEDWHAQLAGFAPDAVVVQSVEVRPDELPVPPLVGQAQAVAAWCRAAGVPSVFWSTVDGGRALDDVWTTTAFDHVATADLDAILAWRSALGHDRVHLAPLAVQPAPADATATEPVPAAVLAAAFDPSRGTEPALLDLLQAAVAHLPVLVHDLPPGDGTGVPAALRALVAPPPEDLAQLDRSCRLGLHVPPATQSPTLLDRRLLQLLAAGTPVVGAHSHAAVLHFGDVTTATGDRTLLAAAIRTALEKPDPAAREVGRARVLRDHTWQRAATMLLAPVLDLLPAPEPPTTADDVGDVNAVRGRAILDAATAAQWRPLSGHPDAPLLDLSAWFAAVDHAQVEVTADHGDVVVTSAADGPTDAWAVGTVHPAALLAPGWTTTWFEVDVPGLVDLRLQFLDRNGRELRTATVHGNVRESVTVPRRTRAVRPGVRVHAPGRARVGGLRLGGEPAQGPMLATGEQLLVTNRYPTYAAPYNNMFVHKRVQGYEARGAATDVLRMVEHAPRRIHEFEQVECLTGGRAVLDELLAAGNHDSIAAHFLTPALWEMLTPHADGRRLCLWIHGFEIQPWWRRAFSYESEAELEHAKRATAARMDMWSEVLADPRPHFVFVSQFLADQAMEDTGVELPPGRYSVIHNPIDTDLFAHHPKDPEQRFNLLSIRPFASNIYANDLTVAAILELADEPWFERLRIRLIGQGRLFVEVTEPVWHLPNVQVEPRFLQQGEIAALHREHGVFLCPSRLDSHGVSRDEAMASGLVPITSEVAAIPEFMDEDCGFLAPPDDHMAIADAIRALVEDPDLFLRMSSAAAARVRRQADQRLVVGQELAVLRG